MTVTDPIGNMLTIIRNGIHAGFDTVEIPFSKLKKSIVEVLKEEGYIGGYEEFKKEQFPFIKIILKYSPEGSSVIHAIKRISKPGRRIYQAKREIPRVLGGFGTIILTTPKGVMTGQRARMANVGGEVICEIY